MSSVNRYADGCGVLMSDSKDYPFVDSAATRMLDDGLRRAMARQGKSLRKIGQELGYKQSVVLSHMALGRVPIPIDRAYQIAGELGINPTLFIRAVLEQRHPDVAWSEIFDSDPTADRSTELVQTLESIAGRSLDGLSSEQKRVMREVAADPSPGRRWLSVHEVGPVTLLRRLVPNLGTEGLGREQVRALETMIKNAEADPAQQ
jgi:hypothetical protein